MLPGFRFLFAAIMLSLSLLIFGLGAAALFRAAHESFASTSSWRATPDVPFAQRPETTLPMLATLRVERVTAKAPDTAKAATAPAEPAISEPMTNDQVAALRPAEAPVTEIAKPDDPPAPVVENQPAPEVAPAAPAAADATTTGQTKTAAVTASDAASVRSEPATAQAEPVAAAPAASAPDKAAPVAAAEAPPPATEAPATATTPAATTETGDAMTKIATLGGPPVEVTDNEPVPETRTVKLPRARPDESVIKKRQQALRALRRRRLAAARARLAALQQLQANPFGQPQQTYAQPQQNFATTAPR